MCHPSFIVCGWLVLHAGWKAEWYLNKFMVGATDIVELHVGRVGQVHLVWTRVLLHQLHSKQNTIHETLSCHMICTTCSRHTTCSCSHPTTTTTTLFLQPTTHDDHDDDHDRRENYHVTNHGTNFPSFVGLIRALAPPSCYCTEKESSLHLILYG
jgi:hypothetical protein